MAQVTLPATEKQLEEFATGGKGFDTFINGTYSFQVKSATVKKTKNNDDMIVLTAICLTEGSEMGKVISDRITLIESVYWKFYQLLNGLGYTNENIQEVGGEFETNDFVGMEFDAEVKTSTYNKKDAAGLDTGEKGESSNISKYISAVTAD